MSDIKYLFQKSGSVVTIVQDLYAIVGRKRVLSHHVVRRCDSGKEFLVPKGSLTKLDSDYAQTEVYSIFFKVQGLETHYCDCTHYIEAQRIAKNLLDLAHIETSWVELKGNRK